MRSGGSSLTRSTSTACARASPARARTASDTNFSSEYESASPSTLCHRSSNDGSWPSSDAATSVCASASSCRCRSARARAPGTPAPAARWRRARRRPIRRRTARPRSLMRSRIAPTTSTVPAMLRVLPRREQQFEHRLGGEPPGRAGPICLQRLIELLGFGACRRTRRGRAAGSGTPPTCDVDAAVLVGRAARAAASARRAARDRRRYRAAAACRSRRARAAVRSSAAAMMLIGRSPRRPASRAGPRRSRSPTISSSGRRRWPTGCRCRRRRGPPPAAREQQQQRAPGLGVGAGFSVSAPTRCRCRTSASSTIAASGLAGAAPST